MIINIIIFIVAILLRFVGINKFPTGLNCDEASAIRVMIGFNILHYYFLL